MSDLKCPFRHTLIQRDFGCEHAGEITRREGPDVACQDAVAQARCTAFFAHLRAGAVPAFGVEDDLTQMPQSVLVKIQFGGLLGLGRLLGEGGGERVDNVNGLVVRALQRFGTPGAVPVEEILPDITAHKVRRRRG